MVPRRSGQAGRSELVEGVGEDMNETSGEDDAGGKRLDEEEVVPLWTERRKPAAQPRDDAADGAGGQDGEDRGDVQLARLRLVRAGVVAGTLAVGEDRRWEEEQCGQEEQ